MRTSRRTLITLGLAAVALLGTACPGDPPGPPAPVWTPHHAGGPAIGGVTPWVVAIGTTAGWYAQLDAQLPFTGPSTVSLFPRTGVNGDTLGAPQTFPTTAIGLGGGALSDHLLLTGSNPVSGSTDLQFIAESGGAWAPAGTFPLASGETIRGLTDDSLVTQFWGPTGPEVRVYTLSRSGGTVTAALSQSLLPPAEWGGGYGLYWGGIVSLDGGLLAIHAHNEATGVPDRVAVYERGVATFELVATLARPGDSSFGVRLAIDDQPTVDRLVVGAYPSGSTRMTLVEYTSTDGGTWAEAGTIAPPAGVSGERFGQALGLDGAVLVVTAVAETMATPGPGGVARTEYRPLVYRHGATGWVHEATLGVVASPVDTDGLDRGLMSIVVSGSHIVATNGVGLPSACSFCFSARLEAWRWDRSPA